MVGDMVVRHQTRHWQGHDGQCLCQTVQETIERVFWQCPRYSRLRWGSGRCSSAAGSQLPLCQRVLGTPLVLPELAAWRAAFRPFVWARPQWQASEIYADGSGRNPKDPHVRVVGWAFCAKLPGGWVCTAGWLEPGATVTAGEATAVARALEVLRAGGLVVTDCQAVWKMWHRIRRNPQAVIRGVSHPYWLLLAEALGRHPSARCEWMRSHRSLEEARQAGYPAAWHEGNARADAGAKAVALARDVPGTVLAAYRRQRETAEQAAGTIAAIQLSRLQARTRTPEGGAVKERRRKAPALPRRLRPQGQKRKRPSTGAALGACRTKIRRNRRGARSIPKNFRRSRRAWPGQGTRDAKPGGGHGCSLPQPGPGGRCARSSAGGPVAAARHGGGEERAGPGCLGLPSLRPLCGRQLQSQGAGEEPLRRGRMAACGCQAFAGTGRQHVAVHPLPAAGPAAAQCPDREASMPGREMHFGRRPLAAG